MLTHSPQALEARLIDFGAAVCEMLRRAPKDFVGEHLANQLIRSCTSSAANYAEARSAESRRDFAHKMQICLKELRETAVWLRLTDRLCGTVKVKCLTKECDELISIFVSSIQTTKGAHTHRRS